MEFSKGDRVSVSYEGVVTEIRVIEDAGLGQCLIIKSDAGVNHAVYVASRIPPVDLLRSADWPPVIGDLWDNGDGDIFFCYSFGGSIKMKNSLGWSLDKDEFIRKYPRANLIRRNK